MLTASFNGSVRAENFRHLQDLVTGWGARLEASLIPAEEPSLVELVNCRLEYDDKNHPNTPRMSLSVDDFWRGLLGQCKRYGLEAVEVP